jgi:hypothetical protein
MPRFLRPLAGVAIGLAAVIPGAVEQSPPASAASATIDCAPQPAGAPVETAPLRSYSAINPVRLLDTRNNVGGIRVPIERGCTLRLNVAGDVPADAQAVAFSMTAVSAEADYFTVYPCASGRPPTSNLNSRAGVPTPNLVVAIPDASRQICVFSHGRSHLVMDLVGWWSEGPNRFSSIAPQRVYDSRRFGLLPLQPLQVREVVIPASVIAADARAAVVNLTTSRSSRGGYLVAFPCGQPAPLASNLNFIAGEDRAVGAIVGLGLGRTLCLMSDVPTDVIVDVTGYYGPAPGFGPTAALQPDAGRRVVDSRNGVGGPRLPFRAGEIRSFDPVAGLPNAGDATAVSLNFISTRSTGSGYLTVFPCGGPPPEVSSLNFRAREEATNLATVQLGADGLVCVLASAPTDVVVDVFGVMNAPAGSPFERLTFDKPTWPSFDPANTDYVIECGAGAGEATVSVDLKLLPLTTATISTGGRPPVPVGSGVTSTTIRTDEALVLSTIRRGVPRAYHFRCVPLDFPRLSVDRPGNPTAGWYLTTFGFGGQSGTFLTILNEYGAPVWYKRSPAGGAIDLKRLSDGRLAFTPSFGAYGIFESQGYWLTPLAGTSTELRRTTEPGPDDLPTDHHDFLEIPGGYAIVSYPLDVVPTPDPRPPWIPEGPTFPIADGVIQEVSTAGTEIWRWTMSDHFDPAASTFPLNFGPGNSAAICPSPPVFCFPDAWDVFHINAIDRVPGDGDYVVTARHTDAVIRVDRATGNVVWTLGGPAPRTGPPPLTVVGDPYDGIKRPHDARLIGNVLTVFDNQAGMPGRVSRAVAYSIDETAGTATFLWEIRNTRIGPTLGSVRQAADGSVLIGWGDNTQPMIEEFASDLRTRLLSITQMGGGSSYRTVKYPPSAFEVAALRATAGGAVASP